MNRLLLLFHSANASVAQSIADQLRSAIGDLQLVALDQSVDPSFTQTLQQQVSTKVLLLVSDNLLKFEKSVGLAMDVVQLMKGSDRLMPVVTEGRYPKDGGEVHFVNTSYERISHIIQYMNYWQEHYLELRRQVANQDSNGQQALNVQLKSVRFIYQNISEMFTELKNRKYTTLESLQNNSFLDMRAWLGEQVVQAEVANDTEWAKLEEVVPQASTEAPVSEPNAAFQQHEDRMEHVGSDEEPEKLDTSNEAINMEHEDVSVEEPNTTFVKFVPAEMKHNVVTDLEDILGLANDEIETPISIPADENQTELKAENDNEHLASEAALVVNEPSEEAETLVEWEVEMPIEAANIEEETLTHMSENDPELAQLLGQELAKEEIAATADGILTEVIENSEDFSTLPIENEAETEAPIAEEEASDSMEEGEKHTTMTENEVNTLTNQAEVDAESVKVQIKSPTSIFVSEPVSNAVNIRIVSHPAVPVSTSSEPIVAEVKAALIQSDSEVNESENTKDERLQIAIAKIDSGKNEEAVEALVSLIADFPQMSVARLTLAGLQAEQMKDYKAACKTLDSLLQHDGRNEDALFLIGHYSLAQGEVWRSRMFWERLMDLNPEYPHIHENLGDLVSAHYMGQFKQVAKLYKRALLTDPTNVKLLNKQAEVLYMHLGKHEKAAVLWMHVLQMDPDHAHARMRLIELQKVGISVVLPPTTQELEALRLKELQAIEAAKLAATRVVNDNGKVVLITGATSGIGKATAALFASHGYRTLLTGRREQLLDDTASQLFEQYGNLVATLNFDIRSNKAIENALSELPEDFANIDILINNAGLAKGLAPIHEGSLDHWDQMIDTNLKGLLYITRMVAPGMVERKSGHIINIGSTAGKEVYPNGNVYCATKFAVDALTRAMRQDLYTHGIRVSQISPGHVEDTEFALVRFDGDSERADIYQNFKALGPDDVARVLYFVATQPPHVNIQDVLLMSTQQASATLIDRSGK